MHTMSSPHGPQPKVDTLFAVPFKGGQQLEPVRTELYNERLVVYRHDLVYEDVLAHNVSALILRIRSQLFTTLGI